MSTEHLWVAPGVIVTDISDRLERPDEGTPAWSVTSQAEEGSNGTSVITIDDPLGDFEVPYLNNYRVRETESEAADPYIFAGAFANSSVIRDVYRTGVSRKWQTDVVDGNVLLNNYVFREGDDPERPQEDHSARMTWLLGTSAMANIDDVTLVDTSATVTMSETDYTGQTPADVLRDLIRQSGYDMFIYFFGVAEEYGLIYQPPDADYLSSDIRITNIIADVTGDGDGNTFYWSQDAELEVDTSRIASHVLARGDGIETFSQRTPTAVEYGRRDVVMDEPNVRSQTVLDNRVARILDTLSSPEYIPTGSIIIPRTKASQVRAGMRVQFRASHWPGFEEWTWGRILRATHTELPGDGGYEVRVELDVGVPVPVPGLCGDDATPTDVYGPTNSATSDGVIYYGRPGTSPPETPTPGWVGNPNFPEYGTGGSPDFIGDCALSFVRVMVVGSGTLEIQTAVYAASTRALTATLYHRHFGDPDLTVDDTDSGLSGSTFTFTVSTHDGEECIHWVDVVDTGEVCGGKYGFVGADWTSTE